MSRILFMYDRAFKRSGRAASCRLQLTEWTNELERMCVASFIQDQMRMSTDQDGNRLFDDDILQKVQKRTLDG